MSQFNKILYHLQSRGSITPLEALEYHGCFRLAARINDLRADGYEIRTEMESGHGKRWAKYVLEREPVQAEMW